MFLFLRHAKAGAHHSTLVTPAFPHSNTTLGGAGKAAVILRKLKMHFWLPRPIVRPKAKIFIQPVWLNELARIHLPLGIPDSLELRSEERRVGKERRSRLWT